MIIANLKKWPHIKYGKLTSKEAKEIPLDKICVYIIGSYFIRIKGSKEILNIKALP